MTRGLTTARQRAVQLLGRFLSHSDIPDSVVYQWRAEDFADLWSAYISERPMSVNGMSSSLFSNNITAVSADRNSVFGMASGTKNLLKNESFGIALTPQYSRAANCITWLGVDDGNNRFLIQQDDDADNATTVNIDLGFIDANDNQIRLATQDIFNDGH